jgi:uncharacterized Zn-finger protein
VKPHRGQHNAQVLGLRVYLADGDPGGVHSLRHGKFELKALAQRSENMTDEVIPHFHNDLGVQIIEIGAKKFMCMGALPPQDHPHVFCDMGEDVEYVCPYCSTLYRLNSALAPNQARPAECEFHDSAI